MSTSSKHPNTIRQGGPGASHENAKKPLEVDKPPADPSDDHVRSRVSTGGGEEDSQSSQDPRRK